MTGDEHVELCGRLTWMWSRPATSVGNDILTLRGGIRLQGARSSVLSRDDGEKQSVARVAETVEAISVRSKAHRSN